MPNALTWGHPWWGELWQGPPTVDLWGRWLFAHGDFLFPVSRLRTPCSQLTVNPHRRHSEMGGKGSWFINSSRAKWFWGTRKCTMRGFYCILWVSDPDMHHGTCVTHVPWCMPGSLNCGFLWSWWRGKRSRHYRCMRNPQFYVSGKRPMRGAGICNWNTSSGEERDLCMLHRQYHDCWWPDAARQQFE